MNQLRHLLRFLLESCCGTCERTRGSAKRLASATTHKASRKLTRYSPHNTQYKHTFVVVRRRLVQSEWAGWGVPLTPSMQRRNAMPHSPIFPACRALAKAGAGAANVLMKPASARQPPRFLGCLNWPREQWLGVLAQPCQLSTAVQERRVVAFKLCVNVDGRVVDELEGRVVLMV